jgi:predicted small secreted protein
MEALKAMKKTGWGILAIVLVCVLVLAGCDTGSGGGSGAGGTFVLTNIPPVYNGMYASFEARSYKIHIVGYKSITPYGAPIPAQISNGKVSLPMWVQANSYFRYSGNDSFTYTDTDIIRVTISDSDSNMAVLIHNGYSGPKTLALIGFSSITFSRGNATKSVNDGVIIDFKDLPYAR